MLNINRERTAHQFRPWAVPTTMRRGLLSHLSTVCVRVFSRILRLVFVRKRWHDERAKFVSGGKHTRVPDNVRASEPSNG
jgi:hypothetical protein